jgi:hypothetical protein
MAESSEEAITAGHVTAARGLLHVANCTAP